MSKSTEQRFPLHKGHEVIRNEQNPDKDYEPVKIEVWFSFGFLHRQ